MAGLFELFVDAASDVRFRLLAPDGTVMAVSKAFDDKPAAVAGIAAVREYAGMGHIIDRCQTGQPSAPPPRSGQPVQAYRAVPASDPRTLEKALRRSAVKTQVDGRRVMGEQDRVSAGV
jgi:uncharacterized protein YegP (UPF0339 family)